MNFPIPNVINDTLDEAKRRLYEYDLDIAYKPSSVYLPNHIISYFPKGKKLHLDVAIEPKDSFSLDDNIAYVHRIAYVTGRKSINKNVLNEAQANMTDLGIVVATPHKYLYLYGDTFSGFDVNDGYWNSNFIAYSNKHINFDEGIKFDGVITDEFGNASPIKQGLHHRNEIKNLDINLGREVTKIPTGGIYLNGYVYIFLMHVRYWGKPGEWFVTSSCLYKAKEDDLSHFQKVDSVQFKQSFSDRFGQIYPFLKDGYVYLLSIPGGRFGHISLLRVKCDDFENLDKYELLVDKDKFVNLKDGIAMAPYYLVQENGCGEPSIMFNKYLKKWIISTLTNEGIKFYLNDNLNEQFHQSMLILTHEQVKSCYGGFIHDDFVKYSGQKMYFQVSQWSPIYNTSLFEVVFK